MGGSNDKFNVAEHDCPINPYNTQVLTTIQI
jgi:hypothetical protein